MWNLLCVALLVLLLPTTLFAAPITLNFGDGEVVSGCEPDVVFEYVEGGMRIAVPEIPSDPSGCSDYSHFHAGLGVLDMFDDGEGVVFSLVDGGLFNVISVNLDLFDTAVWFEGIIIDSDGLFVFDPPFGPLGSAFLTATRRSRDSRISISSFTFERVETVPEPPLIAFMLAAALYAVRARRSAITCPLRQRMR